MKTLITMICCVLLGCILAGCATAPNISPYDHGVAVGMAVYLGYSKIAEGKSDAFKSAVASIWEVISSIQSTETMATDIGTAFDNAVSAEGLSAQDKRALEALRGIVLSRIDAELNSRCLAAPEAVEFLNGARAGINAMIATEKTE